MVKETIIEYVKKHYLYILVGLLTFGFGSMVGPSNGDLNEANNKINELEYELLELEDVKTSLNAENISLEKENEELIAENEELEEKLEDATFWLELTEQQREQIEADIKAEEEAKLKAEQEAKEKAEQEAQAQTQAAEQSQTSQQSTVTQTPSSSVAAGPVVYTTPSGKRYHVDQECGGKNSSDESKDKAVARGLTPCQKCAQ